MSARLATLLAETRSAMLRTDNQRFLRLQEAAAQIAIEQSHPTEIICDMLSRYSTDVSTGSTMTREEGWERAAEALAGALPDPDDVLYGLLIATEVWALGLQYALPDMVRFLRRMAAIPSDNDPTGDEAQDAYELYELLLNRLIDLNSMLNGELDNEDMVETEWSRNPDTLANAMDLLYRTTNEYAERIEADGTCEVGPEEFDEIVEWSGHFLWACYHAAENGIPFEELAEFVEVYPDDWHDVLRGVLDEHVLFPGVLAALTETTATADQVLATGAEAIALYRAARQPVDMTLVDYLNLALAAPAFDA